MSLIFFFFMVIFFWSPPLLYDLSPPTFCFIYSSLYICMIVRKWVELDEAVAFVSFPSFALFYWHDCSITWLIEFHHLPLPSTVWFMLPSLGWLIFILLLYSCHCFLFLCVCIYIYIYICWNINRTLAWLVISTRV